MRLKKFVLAFLILFAFPALGSAQELLSRGWIVSSHSNDSDAAPDAGLYFSVPQGQSVTISMQTSFAVNPASVTIQLQTSLDASIWTTIVSSSVVTGETITAYNQVTKYVRANVSARAGGSGVTTQLLANYSYGGSYLNGLVSTSLLLPDGTCPIPALGFNSDNDGTGTGLFRFGANSVGFCANGVGSLFYNSAQAQIPSTSWYGISGSTIGAASDVQWARRAAGTPVTNLGGVTFATTAGSSVTQGGILCVNTTSQATIGTSEEILATCTLPANAMSANGKGVRITAWGVTAANANSKTFRVRFGGIGGTSIAPQTTTGSAIGWRAVAEVIRTGAATQVASGVTHAGANVSTSTSSSPAQTLSNAVDIVITGQTGTAAGDLTFQGLIVEFFN